MDYRNENPGQPPHSLLKWMERMRDKIPTGRITGESLKYFRSRLPVAVFEINDDEFTKLSRNIDSSLLSIKLTHPDRKELKLLIKLDDRNEDFHCIVRSKQMNDRISSPRLSVDRLFYDPEASIWKGMDKDLEDLDQGELRVIESEKLKTSECIQVCALSSMLSFRIEEKTLGYAIQNFRFIEAQKLSRKFKFKQFRKIVCGARPSEGFLSLDKIGALDWFLPELAASKNLTQNRYHKYDIFYHSIYCCDSVQEPNLVLRLAGLFHDLGKVETRKEKENGEASFYNHEVISERHADRIMQRFGFEPGLIKRVKFLVRNHMFHYTAEWTDRAVRRFMRKVRPDLLEDLITLRLADRKASGKRQALPEAIKDLIKHIEEVRLKEADLKIRDLAINGHDLISMGLKPGPEMGQLLKNLLEQVKTGELFNEKEALIQEAEKLILIPLGSGRTMPDQPK